MNDKIKSVICKKWENNNCLFSEKECWFAHGVKDIINLKCLNGNYCYNEYCIYTHPKEWNPDDNKFDCKKCIDGNCDKSNNKFKHIKKSDNKYLNKNVDVIFKKEDFPEIVKNSKNNDINKKDLKYKYSEIIKCNLKNKSNISKMEHDKNNFKENIEYNNLKNELTFVKKKLYYNYKLLLNLELWSDSIEIDEHIIMLNNRYEELKKLKKNYEINDIYNEDLYFEFLEMNHIDNNNVIDKFPNINLNITLDGNKINSLSGIVSSNEIQNTKNKENEILSIFNYMEKENKMHISKIKNLLDQDKKKEDIYKLNYKFQLNNFISELYLLKINYQDIFEL